MQEGRSASCSGRSSGHHARSAPRSGMHNPARNRRQLDAFRCVACAVCFLAAVAFKPRPAFVGEQVAHEAMFVAPHARKRVWKTNRSLRCDPTQGWMDVFGGLPVTRWQSDSIHVRMAEHCLEISVGSGEKVRSDGITGIRRRVVISACTLHLHLQKRRAMDTRSM